MSALEAKWSLFFIRLNQSSSLSLQTDVPWKAEALLYVCTDVLVFIYWVQGSVSAEIISASQDDQTHLT